MRVIPVMATKGGGVATDQEQILLGTLLGDGHLQMRTGRKNASFSVKACDRDRDYVFWKYKNLRSMELFLHPPKKFANRPEFGRYPSKVYFAWRLQSRADPILTQYHRLFYQNGRRWLLERYLIG